MSELQMDAFEEAAASAVDAGMVVLVADNHQLFLDMDGGGVLLNKLVTLTRFHPIKKLNWWNSKTKGHKHWIITLVPEIFNPAVRVGWQMYLGSDPVKEMLTLERINVGIEGCIRLFQPKDAHVYELQWSYKLPQDPDLNQPFL